MKYKLDKPDISLNLAPMIDVVFLLLIFFIVASTLNVRKVETTINLPDTTSIVKEHKTTEIAINVNKMGEIFIDGQEVPLSKLQNFLEVKLDKIKQKNTTNVSIYADKKVVFQKIVNVMDIVKKLQVENLSFVLKKDS